MQGIRHNITCRCILHQFKQHKNPPLHQFVVFSVINEQTGAVNKKFVQCNNCGIIHKIIGLCESEIIEKKEDSLSLITVDDIKPSLSKTIIDVLDINKCDVSVWEYVLFIIENKLWGSITKISNETDLKEGHTQGKYIQVLNENTVKVNQFVRDDVIKGK
jgi:hypothetical protein